MNGMAEAKALAEARAWLTANWDAERSLAAWRGMLADSGRGMPHWPSQWHGRSLPLSQAIGEAFAAAGAVSVAKTGIRLLAAATLLEHGDDFHKRRFLRRILTGEETWCQLFSEPGSGSDLAGATTRADFDGERWIVNGQNAHGRRAVSRRAQELSATHRRLGCKFARSVGMGSKPRCGGGSTALGLWAGRAIVGCCSRNGASASGLSPCI